MMTKMRLRPEYADQRTCAKCGAMAQKLGEWHHEEAEGGWYFEPKALYVTSFEGDPLAEVFPYRAEGYARGVEKEVTKYAYFRVYTHLCSRPALGGKSGSPFDYECGVLMSKHTNPVRPGDPLPSFCYEVEKAAEESSAIAEDVAPAVATVGAEVVPEPADGEPF